MASSKAPKPWALTESETPASFATWQDNLDYYLSCQDEFARFVEKNAQGKYSLSWTKASADQPVRGLTDDTEGKKTKAIEKIIHLKRMLGLIPQWVPSYLASDIRQNSTGMSSIWSMVRKYYQFEKSEANFMTYSTISREEGERPERLYQRVVAHLQDNLLQTSTSMTYEGNEVTTDEVMSPTVYRLAVLRWMELIHPKLPQLVARTYANDLQTKTLKDLQPLICRAVNGFLEEIKAEDSQIEASRAFVPNYSSRGRPPYARGNQNFNNSQGARGGRSQSYSRPSFQNQSRPFQRSSSQQGPACRVCRAYGRPFNHSISDCEYMSAADKRNLIKSYKVDADSYPTEQDDYEYYDDAMDNLHIDDGQAQS